MTSFLIYALIRLGGSILVVAAAIVLAVRYA
jgi:hypothetical protein